MGIAHPPCNGPQMESPDGAPEPGVNLLATALWDSGAQALLTVSQAVQELVPQAAAQSPAPDAEEGDSGDWEPPRGSGQGRRPRAPVTCANSEGWPRAARRDPTGGEMDGGGCWAGAQVGARAPQSLPLRLLWSHGCKPHWLSGLCVWGGHSLGGSFKSLSARRGVQTLHSSQRSQDLGVPS